MTERRRGIRYGCGPYVAMGIPQVALCYATSTDGLRWLKPLQDVVRARGRPDGPIRKQSSHRSPS